MSLSYDQKYLTFDFETDGLCHFHSRHWQLSWQINQGQKLIKVFDEYIDWPDLKISPEVQKITNFSWDIYNEKKRRPKDVLEEFDNFLYDPQYIIVGQNLLFYDVYIHNTLRRLCGKKPDFSYMPRIYDTRPLGKAYVDGIQKPAKQKDILSWQYKIINDRSSKTKVSQLTQLKRLGIDHDPSKLHNALVDIDMTFKIFWELKKRMDF